MNRQCFKCCPPRKKKKPKRKNNFKIGALMLLLGTVTVFILLLPLKCWVLMLSFVLIACGILLIKK